MTTSEKLLLKDLLINLDKVQVLGKKIKHVYPKFNLKKFINLTESALPERELKQRILYIRDCLEQLLPKDFKTHLNIILKALPARSKSEDVDQDFGDFIYEPFNQLIALQDSKIQYIDHSLKALEKTTEYFSAEFAIRGFLRNFEEITLKQVLLWSKHKNFHVRRLASEGIRPFLPWGERVLIEPKKIINILDNLYSDSSRYVTRSVANNLNDLSKIDPDLVIKTLRRWKKEGKQSESELNYISKQALRTLLKQGYASALEFQGFSIKSAVEILNIKYSKKVCLGENLDFTFKLKCKKSGKFLVDYIIHFAGQGRSQRAKVFKLKSLAMFKGEIAIISKKQQFKKITTRALYPGRHYLQIQINGVKGKLYPFILEY